MGELKKLDAKDFYNTEFLIKYDQYLDLIQKLEKGKTDYMNIFLQYLEFHEQALQMYKNETNEMFIQFGFAVQHTHNKEVTEKKKRMEEEPLQRRHLMDEENRLRQVIEDEQKIIEQFGQEIRRISQHIKSSDDERQKRRLEQEKILLQKEVEQKQAFLRAQMVRLQQLEGAQRGYLYEEEGTRHNELYTNFEGTKPRSRPQPETQPLVVPKPPKSVSKPKPATTAPLPAPIVEDSTGAQTQTSQTQTLIPLNAFKFIEKGNKRFLEPMTPEKAEELSIKKKTIQSETILNPDRFKRKPHVWYSRAR